MSVYTPVDPATLADFLRDYPLGELQGYEGIAAGVENTNYLLTTQRGKYILTLFEATTPGHTAFALDLMDLLAQRRDYFARPIPNHEGDTLAELAGKPAALVEYLPGNSITDPGPGHCRQIGTALAHFHLDSREIPAAKPNPRGRTWRGRLVKRLRHRLETDELALLEDELGQQAALGNATLPRGIIHGDLFRDNVLFCDTRLTGIIDLYNSGRDSLLYDLAITVNDWCTTSAGGYDEVRLTAMVSAYDRVRPVSSRESAWWPMLLRAAALRFWLSRLRDRHFPRSEAGMGKDPVEYRRLLLSHRETRPAWPLANDLHACG